MVINLSGKICLVTGGSRGIGKGVSVQLAYHGAKCYVTGRNGDTLQELNKEVERIGGSGVCIPVVCNHENDNEVKAVFQKIDEENNGQLDLLVNNAYSGVDFLLSNVKKFWEQPEEMWDRLNNVGLRNNYLCAIYAARMMTKKQKGFIINLSSIGGTRYLFGPAYGIGKAAKDRMARDCSVEMKKHNVAFISLVPGPVRTETMCEFIRTKNQTTLQKLGPYAELVETPTYVGKTVAALLSEPHSDIMSRTGRIVQPTDVGRKHGITDENGRTPVSQLQLNFVLYVLGYHKLSYFIPSFIRIPFVVIKILEAFQSC